MSAWEMSPYDQEQEVVTVRCILCSAVVPLDEIDVHSGEDCDGKRWEEM